MNPRHLIDREAKTILLGWPTRTTIWPTPGGVGYWLRGQPTVSGSAPGPRITAAGATMFKTQPDALWAYFSSDAFCDLVAIEVCGSIQNLNDKRSRYVDSGHSVLLACHLDWLKAEIGLTNGGKRPRWKASGTIPHEPTKDLQFPVRYMRVLYSLPNDLYDQWCPNHIPSGHEFFCRHSSLNSCNSKTMQPFSPAWRYPRTSIQRSSRELPCLTSIRKVTPCTRTLPSPRRRPESRRHATVGGVAPGFRLAPE